MKLPQLQETVIVDYGCPNPANPEDEIYWLGGIYHTLENQKRFFILHPSELPEVEMIELFEQNVKANKENTIIHWSMNKPSFGFTAIARRYRYLTGEGIGIRPLKHFDLSEYFKNKYTINYIDKNVDPLNQLAELNGFPSINNGTEITKVNYAEQRLELIYSILQAEIQGTLKTLIPPPKPSDLHPSTKHSDLITTLKNSDVEYESKFYALAYMFDCIVSGEPIQLGRKEKLETIGKEVYNTTGNTFYKAVNEKLCKVDLNSFVSIEAVCGSNRRKPVNWPDVVLQICKHPTRVKTHLQKKNLLK